jgi:hypothetical protein
LLLIETGEAPAWDRASLLSAQMEIGGILCNVAALSKDCALTVESSVPLHASGIHDLESTQGGF